MKISKKRNIRSMSQKLFLNKMFSIPELIFHDFGIKLHEGYVNEKY